MSRSPGQNWIERGMSPETVMCRVLAVFVGHDPAKPPVELEHNARTIRAMAEADASEVQIVSYLKDIQRRFGRLEEPGPITRRTAAVCLWHIAKVAELHEQLVRLRAQVASETTQEPLSEWLAERIIRGPYGADAEG
jgi:hypothetical protein